MNAFLDHLDLPILTFMTGFAGKNAVFDHLVNAVSRLDLFKGVILMCLFWYVWAQSPQYETPPATEERQNKLLRVLIGTIVLGALSRALQLIMHVHQRPLLAGLGLPFPVTGFEATSLNAWNSFPSDHSMFFFALGTGLWAVNRAAGLLAFAWTIVVIDLPRIYLGVHYPSDVLAGALFGWAGMQMILALRMRRLERLLGLWRQSHPGLFMAALFFATDEVAHLLAEARDLAGSSINIFIK